MVFSDTSTKLGLVEDVDFLVSTDSTSYPTAQKTRNINNWYYKTIAWILEASGTWEWDDSNYTNLPIATANLVAGQEDYTLPAATSGGNFSTFLKLQGVSILNSAGDLVKLSLIDESQFPHSDIEEVFETDGLPRFYKEIGNSIKLFPAPAAADVTTTNGIKFYFQRTMDEFAASDTTQQPGFSAQFHRILSLGAAFDYAIAKGLPNAKALREEVEQLKVQLQTFYADRNRDNKLRMSPRGHKGRPRL